jgi:hypothetical protein
MSRSTLKCYSLPASQLDNHRTSQPFLENIRLPKTDRPIKPAPSNIMITGSEIRLAFLTAAVTSIPNKIMVEVNFFIPPPAELQV